MEKYQQGFKKDIRMDKEINDIGSNKSTSKDEVKPVNKQAEDGDTNEFLKERFKPEFPEVLTTQYFAGQSSNDLHI